jgi:hypothetical protein
VPCGDWNRDVCGLSVLVIACGRTALRYCWRQPWNNLLQPTPPKWRTGSGHSRLTLDCCTWSFRPFERTVHHYSKRLLSLYHTTPPSPVHTYLSPVPRSHKPADRVSRPMSPQLLRRLGTLTVSKIQARQGNNSLGSSLSALSLSWHPQAIFLESQNIAGIRKPYPHKS